MTSNKEFIEKDEEINDWDVALGHKIKSNSRIHGMSWGKAKKIVKESKRDWWSGYVWNDKDYNKAVKVLGKRGMAQVEKELYG
jgi:hypothetical protein